MKVRQLEAMGGGVVKVRQLEAIGSGAMVQRLFSFLSFLIDVGSLIPFVPKEGDHGREHTFLSFLID